MAAIRIRNLVKRYGEVVVIPSLDLDIDDHEFVVFVGPSGCGKSTLLRIIAGLEPINEGDLFIGDRRVNDLPASRRDIAMVFQDYALYPHMTVRQNMAFALEMRGLKPADIARRVAKAAGLLHIEDYLERKPKALSGGQRQRVAMGRAIVRDPQVFLFDEPLSNLDAKLRGEVRAEIKALSQALRTTMVFVTHDQIEAMTMADRIFVLQSGVIQQQGAPRDIYERPANSFVAQFIGSPTINRFKVKLEAGQPVLTDGRPVPGADYVASQLRASGEAEAWLGIRPEHMLVDADGPQTLDARVTLVEPLGSDTLIHVDSGGLSAIARISPDLPVKVGDDLKLSALPAKMHLFDVRDGRRLGAS